MYKEVVSLYKLNGIEKQKPVFFTVFSAHELEVSQYEKYFGKKYNDKVLVSCSENIERNTFTYTFPKEDIYDIYENVEVSSAKIFYFIKERIQKSSNNKPVFDKKDKQKSGHDSGSDGGLVGGILVAIYYIIIYLLKIFKYFWNDLVKLSKLLLVPLVWYFFGVFVYFISISGVIYNISNDPQFIGTNQDLELEYLSRMNITQYNLKDYEMTQYKLESVLMSFLMCATGVGLVGVNLAPRLRNIVYVKYVTLICLAIIFFSLYQIDKAYRVKDSLYNPTMSAPAHYVKGPLGNDRGNRI